MAKIVESIQMFDLSTTGASTTGTLASGTDIDQCMVSYGSTAGPNGNGTDNGVDCWLSGTDVVNVARVGTTDTLNVIVYVTEFTSAVTVQQVSYSTGNVSTTAAISAVVLANSFIVPSALPGAFLTGRSGLVRAHFNSTTEIGFVRENSAGTMSGHATVLESTEFDTQEFEAVAMTGASTTSTPSSYSLTRSFLVGSRAFTGNSEGPGEIGCTATMTDSTTITYDRIDTNETITWDMHLVECNDDAFLTESGTHDMDAQGTQDDVTITSVDTDDAIAFAAPHDWGSTGTGTADTDVAMAAVSLEITAATTLSVVKGKATTDPSNVRWQVVTWDVVVPSGVDESIYAGFNF